MKPATSPFGQPIDRVDGPLKVTGQARYAGEFHVPGLLYGSVVNSGIARGRIVSIDASAAEAVPGVVLVLTHQNRPPIASYDEPYEDDDAAEGSPFRPLFNDRILYSGQPIALVVAENLELARYAGSLVRVEYDREPHRTDLLSELESAHKAPAELPPPRGDVDAALRGAPLRLDLEYSTPVEHHNPMEPHASTVHYLPEGKLEIYDKTQGVQNCMRYVEGVFGMEGKIRVLSPFVGGAFGSGLRPQHQLPLAVMAALKLKRSVRVTLKRQQMFTFGYRPRTVQRFAIGAAANGQLVAISHQAIGQTSSFEDFTEHEVEWSGMLYQCPNVKLDYQLVPLDVYTPLDMRAPGAAIGVFALECAMDELAYAAKVDPLTLRLTNYAERNGNEDKPYSSKELRQCYEQGAERFGWSRRSMEPRSMRDGNQLIGWGLATGVWEAMQMPASAKACIEPDGRLVVSSATADIGTGTYTVMTQIAAAAMGLPMERVEFRLGDSNLSQAPLEGGSATVSSVGSAVQQACEALCQKILDTAQQTPVSPFTGAKLDDVEFVDGQMRLKAAPAHSVEIEQVVAVTGVLEAEVSIEPGEKRNEYSTATHSAVFVEVRVDETLGTVKVSRVVSAVAAGRVVNPKTAGNQIAGGVVWGISQALHEETMIDHALGRYMNHNLSEYHVPVNADIGEVDVIFVEEKDEIVNALGSKGVGEIGNVGVAAAVANAIYHATGKRVRDLPITMDKLL
ncbi:xanthine dehydrogenase family protein molybdopterin-binding subunit [Pseudomonas sp. MTM4]|uniref:xanthine dehydrogenase family protein molybdopterin-binding subunit n=1 Tax=unclassified Pseudomonas TaxID=196821 RepID=UPI0018D2569B|nr:MULTISPECIES: xanthine dehydrogenase family protein molybdopterin-binding subunit [unclassified Pseudomonas]MBC8651563.1 xanthine dehydrogenase family protein molybdopterin-binding subunit [Pseudomonas sp. MT4]QXY91956.1 xanthine dehydrogenase family protein molybdopterin-binding subunit [Pseudomonas sp. MTM4]